MRHGSRVSAIARVPICAGPRSCDLSAGLGRIRDTVGVSCSHVQSFWATRCADPDSINGRERVEVMVGVLETGAIRAEIAKLPGSKAHCAPSGPGRVAMWLC